MHDGSSSQDRPCWGVWGWRGARRAGGEGGEHGEHPTRGEQGRRASQTPNREGIATTVATKARPPGIEAEVEPCTGLVWTSTLLS
jgi:hypothetical protein